MSSSVLKSLGVASLMSLLSFAASAELVMDSRPKPPPPPVIVYETIPASPVVVHSGKTPAQVRKINTNFKEVPVLKVLRTLIPKNFKALSNDVAIDKDVKITLKGGNRPWDEVLADVLHQVGCKADLNWDKKELILSKKKV